MRVNYTRKILHFLLFLVPLALAPLLPAEPSLVNGILSGIVLVGGMAIFTEPVRTRVAFVATAFASFDRPEDRPYTMLWLTTQVAAAYVVVLLMVFWLEQYNMPQLIGIAVLVAGVGDGLAEPVGVRFGRHKYRTRALFTDRIYTRSLEGSACVFISGILAVLALSSQLTPAQLVLSLVLIPPIMTATEAFSPHTWDGPFLYLTGGATMVAVLELSTVIGP